MAKKPEEKPPIKLARCCAHCRWLRNPTAFRGWCEPNRQTVWFGSVCALFMAHEDQIASVPIKGEI